MQFFMLCKAPFVPTGNIHSRTMLLLACATEMMRANGAQPLPDKYAVSFLDILGPNGDTADKGVERQDIIDNSKPQGGARVLLMLLLLLQDQCEV
jgi:hypothetical protein